MSAKLKVKPSRILQMAVFPLIAVFSVGFILFLRPFGPKNGKFQEEDPARSKDQKDILQ